MTDSEPLNSQQKITASTARINWTELERAFAQGKVIYVAPELNLVEVATAVIDDNRNLVEQWQQQDAMQPLTAEQAIAWSEDDRDLWAVVVAPWVLVQRRLSAKSH